jgi:ABC-2 type transport system ATP-binding protein
LSTSTSGPAVISVQGLVKDYGAVHALRGVDLEVERGEIFGFLGPNGAGKTTTIRCLLDLIRPQSGSISILGINPQSRPDDVRARCGYLPGELHFEDSLTVEDILRFLGQLRGGKADMRFASLLAERIGLELKPQIKNLSKGNKQKVGIVQALMHRPELLLLDEPTIGLDPLVQHEVLEIIQEACHDGATVFFSSHILSEVQEITDRVAIIREGVVVEVAATQELIRRAVHRVNVRFRGPTDASALASLPGVTLLGPSLGTHVRLQVQDDVDSLIKALAHLSISDIDIERPSLEEIFLAYYGTRSQQGD